MNPQEFLLHLPPELWPIQELASELLKISSWTCEGAALKLCPEPDVAPDAYAVWLYRGLPTDSIKRYSVTQRVEFPTGYAKMLSAANGARVFDVNLFGIPTSMLGDPALLDRVVLQPLDVAAANHHWRLPYGSTPDTFHFGSSPWSRRENVGYFLCDDGSVDGFVPSRGRVGAWPTISDALSHEIARVRAQRPQYGDFSAS